MSEWFYIRLAFGLTWVVLGGYLLLLHRRRRAAERAIEAMDGGAA
ncbi:MAG TPA: heme exporter protein CcmD [Longimicrobiales bacterium]|nr:heme exporter protein CcmD [Longimicrobiales bacterium]